MKKILLLFFVVSLFPVFADGQSLIINEKGGEKIELGLENLRKISFSDGSLVATYRDGTYSNYALSSIGKMEFTGMTGVDTKELIEGKLAYSSVTGIAVVTGAEGADFAVYNLSGVVVLKKKITSQIETIDLNELKKGLYFLNLGGKAIKIAR